eukprot:5592579-Pyramimonas_sp.AAC.1
MPFNHWNIPLSPVTLGVNSPLVGVNSPQAHGVLGAWLWGVGAHGQQCRHARPRGNVRLRTQYVLIIGLRRGSGGGPEGGLEEVWRVFGGGSGGLE